jgi:hypothetical protein
VSDGTVVLIAEDGAKSDPAAIKDGKFTGKATAGNKKVQIRASRIKEGGAKDAMGQPVPQEYIPASYNDATTLKATVTERAADNQFTFALKSGDDPAVSPR